MLTADEVREIRSLAEQGLSHRAIAQQTRHGRVTIGRVLANSRCRRPSRGERPQNVQRALRAQVTLSIDYHRCPDCGRLVRLPCLACRIEYLQTAKRYSKNAA